MRLLLVRHGQTSWNNSGRAQGHTDIPLDPTGLDQAMRLGDALLGMPIDRILTSNLLRASQTAEAISRATGAPLELRSDLRERSFGEWEGVPFTEIGERMRSRAEKAGISPQQVCPPGGESFQMVWDRLEALHQELRSSDDTIAVVSHGGALALLTAKLIKGTLDTSRAFRFANTGVTELERRAEGLFLIKRYDDTSHLSSELVLSGSLDGISR